MKNRIKFKNIGIVGVGLIGGSIAMGLKAKLENKITLYGLCKSPKSTNGLIEKNIIDRKLILSEKCLNALDILILATPIISTMSILNKIAPKLSSGIVVMDVGSTKKQVCDFMKFHHPKITFIGTHPMAGSELSGSMHAQNDLFKAKIWIVINDQNVIKSHLSMVYRLIALLGSQLVVMNTVEHDKLMAAASHVPSLISSILIDAIMQNDDWISIKDIVSNGFLDTTRLAGQNIEMKKDIIMTNKKNILKGLQSFQKSLTKFTKTIKNEDEKELIQILTNAKSTRELLLN